MATIYIDVKAGQDWYDIGLNFIRQERSMFFQTVSSERYINIDNPLAFRHISEYLHELILKNIGNGFKSIVFVCIGSDRSTGDSLGPLVGYKIMNISYRNIHVYGNLNDPVHAKNLGEVTDHIHVQYDRPFIVAIDACLGRMDHVGCVIIGEGPLKPGSGVNKNLAPVGDMHIMGIVNFGGFMDFLILQNTRLSIVMKMADTLAMCIRYVLWKIDRDVKL